MQRPYRTVRLLKNHLYPTYQLHAYMANKKTAPEDGLRLAALSVTQWLCQRLGDAAPDALNAAPDPSAYREVGDGCLPSLHMSCGFVVDILSLPEQGMWSLQITEPDLGSDPGNPEQSRQAVPGRVIETRIGFRITGPQLECGFQIVISEPDGTQPQAEVYRPAVVRILAEHPDFGLKQLGALTCAPTSVTTADQLRTLLDVWRDDENQLPCVVFTHPREAVAAPEPVGVGLPEPVGVGPILSAGTRLPPALFAPPATPAKPLGIPYDVEEFARYAVACCRTYLLSDALFERFTEQASPDAAPGAIFLLEPARFGAAVTAFPYRLNASRRADAMERLRAAVYNYPRGKAVSFGHIDFLSAARESMLRSVEDSLQQSAEISDQWAERFAREQARWQAALKEKEDALAALAGQLERQRQYRDKLEGEKERQRLGQEAELAQYRLRLADRDEDIAYLRRKLGQPKEHTAVAAWVKEHFSGRLLLHPKAVALLEDKSARDIRIELICDALDFLATDYWSCRYDRITEDEMNTRCSEKYGRPFEVKPTGTATVEYTPLQYKIKYFPGAAGKPVESPLDWHLCVGNDPENLLRIYFLHDDEKKRIVVGSLPRHLRAVNIK